MKLTTPTPRALAEKSAAEDWFFPPKEVEEKVKAYISKLSQFVAPQPDGRPLSLNDAPDALDRSASIAYMNSASKWQAFYETEIGLREAYAQVLRTGLERMRSFVAFAHKGKVSGLSEAQFSELQKYEYDLGMVEAEVAVLKALSKEQQRTFAAASRNLTGAIAQ